MTLFVVEELYKIDILACILLYNFLCAVFLGNCLRMVEFDRSRIGHRRHEISSNGLFMVLVHYKVYEISSNGLFMASVQYWTLNI